MHKSMQTWSRGLAVFKTINQNWECDLRGFDRGMIVCGRKGDLNISETAGSVGIFKHNSN